MKTIFPFLLAGLLFIAVDGNAQRHAQTPTKHKAQHISKQQKITKPLPEWAVAHGYKQPAHYYFPDYYTFYDAARGGYVFWNDNGWSFTPTMPLFLDKVNMDKSRVQILKGLDLDLHPEQNYPRYMKLYPAQPVNDIEVPVPEVRE